MSSGNNKYKTHIVHIPSKLLPWYIQPTSVQPPDNIQTENHQRQPYNLPMHKENRTAASHAMKPEPWLLP